MDKYEKAVANAFKKALSIVQKVSPPDTHANSLVVAASNLAPLLMEIDLDEEDNEEKE